jgi:hypothetical protein
MRWLLVVLLVLLVACRGALANGEAEFKRARYPSAKQVFASLEQEMRTRDAATRAEYALYRGLTLAALGDRSRAALWLQEAKALEDLRSGTLRPDDARRLAVAMEANEVP